MVTVEIRMLEPKDFNQARKFAITGMHLNRYTANGLELYLYSKFFLNSEVERATQAYGAYIKGRFVGALLVEMYDEKPLFNFYWRKLTTSLVNWGLPHLYGGMVSSYDQANGEMLKHYQIQEKLDGEICFFAVDPKEKGQGIGTELLDRFAHEKRGQRVFLYTDSGCTYQFYQHKGFEKVGERTVTLSTKGSQLPLICLMFSKRL